uniref:Uncharacterized protein n=1 Tax=Oncorhynchus tshawytscha TaxID=74940 RepID=A0AAZ3PXL1_ONCTS
LGTVVTPLARCKTAAPLGSLVCDCGKCPHCQKRFIELRQFTQQLSNIHPNVLAKHLQRGLILPHPELAVINKPYGEYHGRFPVLAKVMAGMRAVPHSQLEVRLGLDKETRETLLLARTDECTTPVMFISVAFSRYCNVLRVLKLASVIDSIFVRNVLCNCIHLTAHNPSQIGLSPVYRVSVGGEGVTNVQANRQAQGAVTHNLFTVSLASSIHLLLIGVRIHTPAYALGCHILGDHKNFHLR